MLIGINDIVYPRWRVVQYGKAFTVNVCYFRVRCGELFAKIILVTVDCTLSLPSAFEKKYQFLRINRLRFNNLF